MRSFTIFLSVVAFFLFANKSKAQQHIPVFPGDTGEILIGKLKDQFRPISTLGYGPARDTLFLRILAVHDSIKCLYTDFAIRLEAGADPSTSAFDQGINTEHIIPQSKGAESEPMRSNMYNIYPVRENVNQDRGNLPFGEIQDQQTNWWYYLDMKQATIPSTNKDRYSEGTNAKFEPKESKKGDIARSIFYFYAVYRNEMDAADPNFFLEMKKDLCQWHIADPIDLNEWNKDQLIALYQEGLHNPFILDCTLPQRSYCSGENIECTPMSAVAAKDAPNSTIQVFPNPVLMGQEIKIKVNIDIAQIIILDSKGLKVVQQHIQNQECIISQHFTSGNFFIVGIDNLGFITSSAMLTVL